MTNELIYYVYTFLREDMSPYYIGKGSGNRAYVKRRKCTAPPVDRSRIVILQDELSEDDAYRYEALLIKLFGRKDLGTGILNNLNEGGAGTRQISPQTREKMRLAKLGKPRSLESRQRQSETAKGTVFTLERCENIRKSKMGYKFSDEAKQKMSQAKLGKPLTEEHKQALRNGHMKKRT